METKYLSSFSKDLKKIKSREILSLIEKNINDIKKCRGYKKNQKSKKAKRALSGLQDTDKRFRMGIFIENNVVEFFRILPRKDIYESFP
ncbi:MAG: hypothetical protein M3R50_04315 [Bacteroidota bacterium]|nr:hypothetical protein [Bacteroidota bacterium]